MLCFKEPIENKVDAMLPVALEEIDAEETLLAEQSVTPTSAKEAEWLSCKDPKLAPKSKSGYILFSAEIRKRVKASDNKTMQIARQNAKIESGGL